MGSATKNFVVSSQSLQPAPSPLWHPVVSLLPEAAKQYCVEKGRSVSIEAEDAPPPDHVYFSTFGALGVFIDDSPICVDTVLPGSVWGWDYALGRNPFRAKALTACEGFLVPAGELRQRMDDLWLARLLNANGTLRAKRLASEVACNAMHTCLQRTAKWILRLWRAGAAGNVRITQSDMAEITGFQRTSVNAACGALQDRGALRILRGRLQVLDINVLHDIACGCDGHHHPAPAQHQEKARPAATYDHRRDSDLVRT